MSEPALPEKVIAIDSALQRALIAHAFGGALALAYYGEPRVTIDIDLNVFLPPDKAERVGAVLAKLEMDVDAGERDGQVRWWWGRTPVDLFFSYDPIHEAMRQQIRRVPFGDVRIPILSPEHLLVCKLAFDRAKDWLDIEQMLLAGDLDLDEIRRWVERVAGADDPRTKRLEHLLAR